MRNIETRFSNSKWPPTGALYPAVWRDGTGVVHRAVGATVHRGIRLMWTACGKHDIPANGAWLQTSEDAVKCPECNQTVKEDAGT